MSGIYVCPLDALDQTLETSGARSMISLMGPGKSIAPPKHITDGFLCLEFNDIAKPQTGLIHPTADHLSQILDFLASRDGKSPLIAHCWMGISRSTATAAIALAQKQPGRDMMELANRLRAASPMATPNPLMIEIADDLLRLDGRLIRAIQSIGRGADAIQGTPFCLEWDA